METTATAAVVTVGQSIVLPAEEYKEFNKLKAEIAAAQRAKEKLVEKWETVNGLPKAAADTQGEYVIVNGNGDEIGKVTVAYRKGYMVKDGYRRDIS